MAVALPSWPNIQSGNTGNNVIALQCLLNFRGAALTIDGNFGSGTKTAVINYQKANGLTQDGVAGQGTLSKIITTVQQGTNNLSAKAAQYLLNKYSFGLVTDGNFGTASNTAIRDFQSKMSITVDGIIGATSWQYLFGYTGAYPPPSGTTTSGLVTSSQLQYVGWPTSVLTTAMLNDLNSCLTRYQITTKARICHFISQCSQESGLGKWTKEIADGKAYEGRTDLGNTQPGDGPKYKGGGYIQLTGRSNYTAFSKAMNDANILNIGVDYVAANYPWTSAGYFWTAIKNLNPLCDSGATVQAITLKVNGGTNGLADRQTYYNRCTQIF